jgi:hypothetical protein
MLRTVDSTGGDSENSVDPVATVAVAAAKEMELGKNVGGLLARALGPLFDEWGKDRADRYMVKRNAARVAERAKARLEGLDEASLRPVPMRVAMRILDESEYCDDEDQIVVEYLGGILASARQVDRNADIANSYAALISRLAVDHLRAHFIIYRCLHEAFRDDDPQFRASQFWHTLPVYIPYSVFLDSFGGDAENEQQELDDIWSALHWLHREGLVEGFQDADRWLAENPEKPNNGPGILVSRSVLGVEMYLWGLGKPGRSTELFEFSPGYFQIEGVSVPVGRATKAGVELQLPNPSDNGPE